MEKLVDTSVLKFRSNTLEDVRKEFGLEKPGTIEQSLDILEQWLLKQDHIVKKDFPRTYLERCLVNCKGSVEKTKTKLDKMCTIRTLMPQYFETFDAVAEFEPYKEGIWHALLPQLTPNNERVYFMKNIGFKHNSFLGFYKHFIKIMDYMNAYDYNTGFHMVMDYTELNVMDFVQKMNPTHIQHWSEITLNGFAMRVRSFQVITSSTVIDLLVSIFRAALSPKLGKRIHVFKDLPEWHAHQNEGIKVPRGILPAEYGGGEKTLKELHVELMAALSSDDFVGYLKDQYKGITNEKLRNACEFNEQHMGMPGSFRQMTVD